MNLNISGDPGMGNSFNEPHLDNVTSYNPNATKVENHLHAAVGESRMTRWFRRLQEELQNDERLRRKSDAIRRYQTKLDRTIGLEQKLLDGRFSPSDIRKATVSKQAFAKKLTRYQYYESAQRIDEYLFAKVATLFDTYVEPLVCDERPLAEIRQTVWEKVVSPVVDEINANGADDSVLCYTADDILGIIYFLTGNCHLNWTDYDVHPRL